MNQPKVRGSFDFFSDGTHEAGITWNRFNGKSPDADLIETKGGGVAISRTDLLGANLVRKQCCAGC
jgi:hypothetical protein